MLPQNSPSHSLFISVRCSRVFDLKLWTSFMFISCVSVHITCKYIQGCISYHCILLTFYFIHIFFCFCIYLECASAKFSILIFYIILSWLIHTPGHCTNCTHHRQQHNIAWQQHNIIFNPVLTLIRIQANPLSMSLCSDIDTYIYSRNIQIHNYIYPCPIRQQYTVHCRVLYYLLLYHKFIITVLTGGIDPCNTDLVLG